MKATDPAPDGCIWVCSACAKTATDRDTLPERCARNAVLCHGEPVTGEALIAGWVPVEALP